MSAESAAQVLDWRRQVHQLYAQVRTATEPAAGHVEWVAGRNALLATHPASPLTPEQRDGFAGVPVGQYDPAYRFVTRVEACEPERREVMTGTDGLVVMDRVGVVALEGLGTLGVWWFAGYGGGVFIPLRDKGSGHSSYGGGRYVLDTIKGADLGGSFDDLVVDLNFAYNPSCAYDSKWACPLPSPGNTLRVDIPVGELTEGITG